MIHDSLDQLKRYHLPCADKILTFIAGHDCLHLPNEQIDIDGENLFVRVMAYETKSAEEKKFETHQVYADLQYIVAGIELMQTVDAKELITATDYDSKGDYQFFTAKDKISDTVVEAGQFVVFYPGEAHKPSCCYQGHQDKVKKLVFKIKIKK